MEEEKDIESGPSPELWNCCICSTPTDSRLLKYGVSRLIIGGLIIWSTIMISTASSEAQKCDYTSLLTFFVGLLIPSHTV